MKIYGIQKLTLLDYPDKIACTLFTGGCNLRCPFCQNGALVRADANALNSEEVFEYLRKRRSLLDGVCITGGEPLMHDSIDKLLFKIKDMGYQVKLDTNGTYPEKLRKIAESCLADYIAMDIKSSPSGYAAASGITNYDISKINESIGFLLGGSIHYEFRTTAVGGLHTLDDFTAIGDWIAGAEKYYLQSYIHSDDILDKEAGFFTFSREELGHFLSQVSPKVKFAALRG